MKERGLTPWFDGAKHKPARRGVYMLMSGQTCGFQYWDGKQWFSWTDTAADAYKARKWTPASPSYQNDNWRGLTCTAFMSPSRSGRTTG